MPDYTGDGVYDAGEENPPLDFGYIDIAGGKANTPWWQSFRALSPDTYQWQSGNGCCTTTGYSRLSLGAAVDVTFETQFTWERNIDYYHQEGQNFGVAFYQAEAGATHATVGRIFFLDLRGGRVLSANPDGSDLKVVIEERKNGVDGIVIDVEGGHIFWTNMGRASADDGSVDRADLDGSHVTRIVPAGGAFTPKQLKLDATHGKLYWSDRRLINEKVEVAK